MIYSLRRSRVATVLPRLEIQGRRLRVELIRPVGPATERNGLYSPDEVPAREVVDERVYDLSEFSAGECYLKYFLLHDNRLRLQDPLNVFVKCPQGYAALFEGPSPMYLVTAIYQPLPALAFDEMHFVFSRPAVMRGEFK